jgi:predicted DNA-binding helix-hairpin-helix protein
VEEVRVTKAPILHTASNIVYDDNKVLKNVGAADKTVNEVLANTTIANNEENSVKDKNVVYMASAPEFVPNGRKPQIVVNVNKNKTREKLRKLNLYQAFPSEAVVSAYLSPAVDTSEERFS